MSLLPFLCATRPVGADAPVVSDPEPASIPYTFPTAPPYNVPSFTVTPTPDGTGSGIHCDVVDFFGQTPNGKFGGYRYWMAFTPWYQRNDAVELPCILASHDGFTWVQPDGLSNPIDADAASIGANFLPDTDLVYDPETGKLWCIYRGSDKLLAQWSADGAHWSGRIVCHTFPANSNMSPAVTRLAPGHWVMFTKDARFTAASPEGPWADETPIRVVGAVDTVWHLDVIWTGSRFWGLFDPTKRGPLRPAASRDGVTWVTGEPIINAGGGGAGAWDAGTLYRSGMQLHPEGDRVRIWYSATEGWGSDSPVSWRIGYTQAPARHWAELG